MTGDYNDADSSWLTMSLTESRVKRFQAALAIQVSLMTGRRISEVLASDVVGLRTQLRHCSVGLAERYLTSSKRVESKPADYAVDLAELCAFCTDVDTARAALGVRDRPASLSPYSRVHEDSGRVDSLSAHLSALHAQLGD